MYLDVNYVNKIGFIDLEINSNIDLVQEINKLKKEKNAIILAHYYQNNDIQDIADFIGDSLALSQKVETIDNDLIVFCGVHFMAETTKILSPSKKVLIPDLNAGCSLADSCKYEEFLDFKKKYPNHKVITYVNTTAEIKSISDVCCTSSNAIQIVNSFDKDQNLIFAPDYNLGSYIKSVTGRENIVLWEGGCHVHQQFSIKNIVELKTKYPNAKIIAHPECKKQVLIMADFIGSTAELLKYVSSSNEKEFIVVTEPGIIHQMIKNEKNKIFLSPKPDSIDCGCNDCSYMKLITLKKLYLTLKYELPEIKL